MSLSSESQDYHLTNNGWVEETFRGDVVGGKNIVDVPTDRVLTVTCYEKIPYYGVPTQFSARETWLCEDKQLIENLKKIHGPKPPWYGYDKVK